MNTSNPTIILQLLVQDMRYHQLIHGIGNLGFQNELNGSDMMRIIAGLMGMPDVSTEWETAYMHFLQQAPQYKISGNGAELLPLATDCYQSLLAASRLQ